MERTLTFGKRIAAGFALALLLIILMGLVAYRSTGLVVAASGWVMHTQLVLTRLCDVVMLLTDAESADRAYILTGDETFLELYHKAERELPEALDELHRLSADNPQESRRIDELEGAAKARLAFEKQSVELRRAQGFEAAAKLVEAGEGRRLMNRVRSIADALDADLEALLRERDAAAKAAVGNARATILTSAVVAAVLAILAGMLLTRSLTARIGSAIQHLQGSAAELLASANQQAATAKEQATSTNEITATVRELLATSRQIAESTQRVARLAEQTGGAARSGEETLRKANEGMATIRRQVDAIVGHMLDLGKKSQQIGAVLEIINELAEQTNILAINATIEAAGAAEEGRRFGAVAEEIRKLADRVGASTKEIRALIDEVRAAANTTVMATEQGAKATDAGTAQFVVLAESFRQIAALVLETTDAAREIELSTRQQATAVEQVSTAMLEVARSAGEVEASSRQTVQVAGQLADLSRALSRIVRPEPGPPETA